MLWRGLAVVHGFGLEQIGLGHGDLFARLTWWGFSIAGSWDYEGWARSLDYIVNFVQNDCWRVSKGSLGADREKNRRKGETVNP